MKNIKRRLTPQPLKIRADVDMTCYAYDGVLHIQVSMVAAPTCGSVCECCCTSSSGGCLAELCHLLPTIRSQLGGRTPRQIPG